ncbi:MAG: hypothetical protein GC168_20840 [Candidatus Hydrogenedens sp.]|nr:hypothetical protein [Candidatus Hydrogenedens sp.]
MSQAAAGAAPYDEIVRPAGAGREALYVLLASGVVLLVALGLIALRHQSPPVQELAEYQISAYSGLNTVEQGLYNDLLAASLEIDLYHADTLTWPPVEKLRSLYIPPFAQDMSWKQRGALQWKQDVPDVELQHTVAYYALSDDYSITGSFILWMTHKHNMVGPGGNLFLQQRGQNPAGGDPLAGPLVAPQPSADPALGAMPGMPAPNIPTADPKAAPAAGAPVAPLKPQVRIWYHPGPAVGPPGLYIDQHLIRAGWKEVMPYSGSDETRRLKGSAQ